MRRVLPLLVALLVLAVPAAAHAAVSATFLKGEQVVGVKRDGTTARDALDGLLAGPTDREEARGVETYVPRGTTLRSLRIEGGTATVDLSAAFTGQRRADTLRARLTQVVSTLMGKEGVQRVRLLVEGRTPKPFAGIDVSGPITLATLRKPVGAPPKGTTKPKPTTTTVDTSLRATQQRLADLGYLLPADVDGLKGPTTTAAVIAFQKWERLGRDGVVGPQTSARLQAATRPAPIGRGSGRRVEVLLDRQLVLAIEGTRVVRTFHVSTGAPATPTPPGAFSVYLKSKAWWSVPFRTYLPYAAAFNQGIAFHEYPSVPTQPASHGCVRMVAGQAKWLYDFLRVGTPVRVLARS